MLAITIVIISLALVFYGIGIWSEHFQRILKPWHTGFFALGLACDSTGTYLMTRIATHSHSASTNLVPVMAITGTLALVLMAVHLLWAIIVIIRNRPHEKHTFHKFSVFVWCLWLIPYVTGAISANS